MCWQLFINAFLPFFLYFNRTEVFLVYCLSVTWPVVEVPLLVLNVLLSWVTFYYVIRSRGVSKWWYLVCICVGVCLLQIFHELSFSCGFVCSCASQTEHLSSGHKPSIGVSSLVLTYAKILMLIDFETVALSWNYIKWLWCVAAIIKNEIARFWHSLFPFLYSY